MRVIFAVLAVASLQIAAAQSSILNRELLKDWVDMKDTMMKLANEMPEAKYPFKTTPAQRDFGQQVLHVAGGNVMNLSFLHGKAVPPAINRARVIYFLLGHCWDIYGQMVVYLRLNGGVPPASQRP